MVSSKSAAEANLKLYKELMRLLFALLAVISMTAGLVLVVWLCVKQGKEWTDALGWFVPFLITSILLFVTSSFLTVRDVKALADAGVIPGVKIWPRAGS